MHKCLFTDFTLILVTWLRSYWTKMLFFSTWKFIKIGKCPKLNFKRCVLCSLISTMIWHCFWMIWPQDTGVIEPRFAFTVACHYIHSAALMLQTNHPDAFLLIFLDFIHAFLSVTLPNFTQFLSCCTRENKTLDWLYANINNADTSTPLPLIGRSDHNPIRLQTAACTPEDP